MKAIHRGATNKAFGLVIFMASLLLGAAVARADDVLDWNAIAMNTIAASENPFAGARHAAIVQLAVFEAVNAIQGHYQPYLGSITAPPGASADAAAIQAAYRVLATYFPKDSMLGTELKNSLAQIPDGQA